MFIFKKRMLILILFILTIFLTTATIPICASDESESTTATIEQLENLKQKHYELRDKSAVLSEAQKDYLRAIGVSEAKLNVITNGEVADLIKTCDIKFPEYIRKYIDRSVLLSEIEESNRVIKRIMSTEGLTVDLQYPVNEIVHPASSNCHIFRGERAKLLLGGEDNVHFHNNFRKCYGHSILY